MADNLTSIIEQYNDDFAAQSLQAPTDTVTTALSNLPPIRSLTTTDSRGGLYDIYRVTARYIGDTGKLLIPVSSPANTRIAKTSVPYGYKIVEFEVARAVLFPELPAVEESDNCQLLDTQLTAFNDVMDASAQKRVYRTAGYYLYAVKTPGVIGTDNFVVPSLPNIAAKSLDLTPSDFVDGIAPVTSET